MFPACSRDPVPKLRFTYASRCEINASVNEHQVLGELKSLVCGTTQVLFCMETGTGPGSTVQSSWGLPGGSSQTPIVIIAMALKTSYQAPGICLTCEKFICTFPDVS